MTGRPVAKYRFFVSAGDILIEGTPVVADHLVNE
jgi:hypothetical protein